MPLKMMKCGNSCKPGKVIQELSTYEVSNNYKQHNVNFSSATSIILQAGMFIDSAN